MNVLFLTLLSFDSLQERTIYTDLLREFVKNGHQVYAISPVEKRQNKETHLIKEENATILRLQIGNTQKTNIIEKGISTVMIEPTFKKAISKYFSNVKFDLVLYSTPPITLVSAIEYVKKRDGAKTYLLLKDIFPQNAVDIGMMSKTGLKGLLYKHFRKQEKKLYNNIINNNISKKDPYIIGKIRRNKIMSENKTNINYYPGHIAKTKKQISEDLKLIDVIIEILDARIPISSNNPDINEIVKNKKKIILLNKSDLASEEENQKWINYFKKKGVTAIKVNCNTGENLNQVEKEIKKIMEEDIKKEIAKGIVGKTIKAMVIGIPNVRQIFFHK